MRLPALPLTGPSRAPRVALADIPVFSTFDAGWIARRSSACRHKSTEARLRRRLITNVAVRIWRTTIGLSERTIALINLQPLWHRMPSSEINWAKKRTELHISRSSRGARMRTMQAPCSAVRACTHWLLDCTCSVSERNASIISQQGVRFSYKTLP